jgi:hypothetical protein
MLPRLGRRDSGSSYGDIGGRRVDARRGVSLGCAKKSPGRGTSNNDLLSYCTGEGCVSERLGDAWFCPWLWRLLLTCCGCWEKIGSGHSYALDFPTHIEQPSTNNIRRCRKRIICQVGIPYIQRIEHSFELCHKGWRRRTSVPVHVDAFFQLVRQPGKHLIKGRVKLPKC